MNIAINAMPASRGGTAVAYLRNVLSALEARQDDHIWHVYGTKTALEQLQISSPRIRLRVVKPRWGRLGRLFTEHLWLPVKMRRDRIDLFFSPGNLDLLLAPRPRIITVHDTDPFLSGRFKSSPWKRLRLAVTRWATRKSLRAADHVVCVSEFAREVASMDTPACHVKSSTIPRGAGAPFSPSAALPDWVPPRFLLAVVEQEGQYNLDTLIDAYSHCRDQEMDCPLLIAGLDLTSALARKVCAQIEYHDLGSHVGFVSSDDHRHLASLMANAVAFVYPSVMGSDSSTLLEAMRCGAAVVAAESPPTREIAGSSVCWCDGANAREMAEGILRVHGSSEYADQIRQRVMARASEYSWESTAASLVNLLERTSANYVTPKRALGSPKTVGRIETRDVPLLPPTRRQQAP